MILFLAKKLLKLLSKLSAKNKYDFAFDMSDEDAVRNINYLAHALRKTARGGAGVPRYSIKLAIEGCRKVVYQKKKKGVQVYDFEEWIYDNYRLLLGALGAIDFKKFTMLPHVDGVPRIIVLADFIVKYSGGKVSADRVRKVVEAFNAVTPLSYLEIVRLKDALVYRLLTEISLFAERSLHYHDAYRHAQKKRFLSRYRHSDSYLAYYADVHGEEIVPEVEQSEFSAARLGLDNLLADNLILTSSYVNSLRSIGVEVNEGFVVLLSSADRIYSCEECYRGMSDRARNDYLKQTSKIAQANGVSEQTVARAALKLGDHLDCHFGEILYYYPEALRRYLKSGIVEPLRDEKTRVQGLYCFLVLTLSLFIAAFPAYYLRNLWAYLSAVPLFIASLHPVEYLLKRLYSMRLKSKPLPQMDYKVLPDECRTVVTVSRFIASKEDADEALLQVETLAASECDPAVSFAVLADLPPSENSWGDGDREILEYLQKASRSERVSVFLRKRIPVGKKWRGYERKRGALLDFLSAVREGDFENFYVIGDETRAQYAILLDDDSELLPGTIRAAILAMAHPLNRKYDLMSFGGKVNRYSIKTHYSLRFLRGCGTEAYPFYTDFYADAFDCALYCGKAIVRIGAYVDKLKDFFPEGRILSHDIIEGAVLHSTCLKRCVYEDAPTTFSGDHNRSSRWQRGDVQLLPYAFCNRVKNKFGQRIKNPIAPIYKLVIFINGMTVLREAMILAALIFAFVSGSIFALAYAISVYLFVKAYALVLSLRSFFTNVRFAHAFRGFILSLELLTEDILLLPFRALSGLYIFLVTVVKMALRSENLLEWTPFRVAQKEGGAEEGARILLPTVILLTALTILFGEFRLTVYTFFFLLYALSLLITGRKIVYSKLSEKKREKLKEYALEIYRYFAAMSGEKVIPDNLQLFPYRMTSRMTSPTNLGFALLAEVCAATLGFIDNEVALSNIEKQLDKVDKLEKYHGHLYNWYDVESFRVLPPHVVSTVDSANFLCCLSVVEAFARELGRSEIACRAKKYISEADFSILYDKSQKCLAIILNSDENSLYGRYDLLASESRLAYYLAIVKGLDPDCYFSLGRECTALGGNTLLSWSGTAFEYMLPRLFVSSPFGSLLHLQEERSGAVQIKDKTCGVFGRSECGYYSFNDATAFRYKAVGCRELALSGESFDVIAPYASFLYLPCFPQASIDNLEALSTLGAKGEFGFYEAIDFDHDGDVVKSYMTHHQGMSLAALTNALSDDRIVRLFSSLPRNRSFRILLNEDNVYERKPRFHSSTFTNTTQRECVCSRPKSIPDTLSYQSGDYTALYDALGRSCTKLGDHHLNKTIDYLPEYGGLFVQIKEGNTISSPSYYPYGSLDCYAIMEEGAVKYVDPHSFVTMEVTPLADYQGERRKLVIENNGDLTRKITVSAYSDMMLNTCDAYLSHPAFSDMFVNAEYDAEHNVQYLSRKGLDCAQVVSASLMIKGLSDVRINCNSYNVIGRCGDIKSDFSKGVERCDAPKVGDVLYPCFGFSGDVDVPPHGSSTVYLITLADKDLLVLKERNSKIDLAYRAGAIELLGKEVREHKEDLALSLELTGRLLYGRTTQSALAARVEQREALLGIGIGLETDLLYFDCSEEKDRRKLLSMVNHCRAIREAGVHHKLIVVCEDIDGAGMSEKEAIERAVHRIDDSVIVLDRKEGSKFRYAAKEVLSAPGERCNGATMDQTFILPEEGGGVVPNITCGEGGFTAGGYSVRPFEKNTLLPYANVVGGRSGGFVITEHGGGFTFGNNSRENKITVWTGDAVRDTRSEEICLSMAGKRYVLNGNHCEHKIGESVFTHVIDGVLLRLSASIFNEGQSKLYEISFTRDLGDAKLSMTLIPALGWRYNEKVHLSKISDGYRLTNVASGESAYVYSLDGFLSYDIPETKAGGITFYSKTLLTKGRYRFVISSVPPEKIEERALAASKARALSDLFKASVQVETRDSFLDRLYNRSLPYQLISSRLNAKTGFYQCSGAFGFRDQLQDVLGLLLSDPARVRAQILLAAAHQYEEGDVQHWWHPPRTGVRTRISDDRLWLVYVTEKYIEVSGDHLVLDEQIPFLSSPVLSDEEVSRYEIPRDGTSASLREHLLRAIRISLQYGEHDLLKIGSGDWNDGLDRVGRGGRGESVWLSMFAYQVIRDALVFYPDHIRQELLTHLERLKSSIQPLLKEGRYPLAFADEGKWLGYSDSDACHLSLNTASWAVISGIASLGDAKRAMDKAKELVDHVHGIVKLLAPPFDERSNYGYIAAYPKGVRENGGQYTHGAVWYLKALLELGEREEAYRIISMLNPMIRSQTREGTQNYQGEPYVLSADVYASPPYIGRAGWSWYTGSAGWLKYVLTEDFFGLKKRANRLYVLPHFPASFEKVSAKIALCGHKIKMEFVRDEPAGLYLGEKKIDYLDLDHLNENIEVICRFS